jgi:hypothetical protein
LFVAAFAAAPSVHQFQFLSVLGSPSHQSLQNQSETRRAPEAQGHRKVTVLGDGHDDTVATKGLSPLDPLNAPGTSLVPGRNLSGGPCSHVHCLPPNRNIGLAFRRVSK